MLDAAEILCLCCQPRGWPLLAPLPLLVAGDALGLLVLVCSRDWYGLWYWHGPFYSLAGEIGMALFITLPYVPTPPPPAARHHVRQGAMGLTNMQSTTHIA